MSEVGNMLNNEADIKEVTYMLEVKIAKAKDLNFIKETYKLLDSKMTKLLAQLMDIGEDNEEELHSDLYWENLIFEKTGYILVAFRGEERTGMAVVERMEDGEAHLEDILVWPDFQKQGIGELLVKEVKDYASKKGYKKMSLNVLANNESARRVYKKQDFQEVKISMICHL